jgi:hypothetical protein
MTIFLKTFANIILWNLKYFKLDLIFISPYDLQIIFSFNFFVLKIFDYEIPKKSIIRMDFIKHFSKYYDF